MKKSRTITPLLLLLAAVGTKIAASRITAVGSGSDYKEKNAAKARRTDTIDKRKEEQPRNRKMHSI